MLIIYQIFPSQKFSPSTVEPRHSAPDWEMSESMLYQSVNFIEVQYNTELPTTPPIADFSLLFSSYFGNPIGVEKLRFFPYFEAYFIVSIIKSS